MKLEELEKIKKEMEALTNRVDIIIRKEYEKKLDKYVMASDLARILSVRRATISLWVKNGIIQRSQQEQKNRKLQISLKEIDELTLEGGKLQKYRNLWINHKIKNNLV